MFDEETNPDADPENPTTGWAMGGLALVMIGIVLLLITCACGSPPPAADEPTTTVTVAVAPPPIPLFEITTPVETTMLMKAVRIDPPETPAPTAEEICNAITYRKLDPEPARICYNAVAIELGWTTDDIAKWDAFLMTDVLRGESVMCPNVMGGLDPALISYVDCSFPPEVQGRHSDAGFFQLHGNNYKPGTYLCVTFGYCSAESIIQSPYHSMRSGLLFVMYDGRGPWCYDADARRHHPTCGTVPRYWP